MSAEPVPAVGRFEEVAIAIGKLTDEKNRAYGDSYARSTEIIRILYPHGVQPEQYQDMLAIVRVLDKLFRIATSKNAFGESPWNDIAGYGVLMAAYAKEELAGWPVKK